MAKGKYQRWLEPDGLLLLEGWARDGLTDEQIAHNMGITAKTLYVWKSAYGEICEALKKGKEIVDIQVENALLKRALGYEYMEERVEISEKGRPEGHPDDEDRTAGYHGADFLAQKPPAGSMA